MPKMHPHAEATYRVLARDDGSFDIEVTIPDTHPTRISPFKTERDAEAWIAEHQRRVQEQSTMGGGRFGRSTGRAGR